MKLAIDLYFFVSLNIVFDTEELCKSRFDRMPHLHIKLGNNDLLVQIIVIIFGSLNVIASTIYSFAEYIIVSDKFEWHQQIMSIYVKRNLLTAFKWPFCNKFKWLCDFLLLLVEIYLLFALIECVMFTYCSAIFRNHKMMKQIAHGSKEDWSQFTIASNRFWYGYCIAKILHCQSNQPKYFTVNQDIIVQYTTRIRVV